MKPSIICLTPIKNEAWILDRFLACASQWADIIIVADQDSTDDSAQIARRFPKVRLVRNPGDSYDENARQKLLLAEARKIAGPRLLIALDADEMLTSDGFGAPEWNSMLSASPGTVFHFEWLQLANSFDYAWKQELTPVGYMDDGSAHAGRTLHSARIPIPKDAPIVHLEQQKILHYHYVDWERMRSKIRWYQCWERINAPSTSPLHLFRRYHPMLVAPRDRIKIDSAWMAGYEADGIDMRTVSQQEHYPWDQQVAQMMRQYGSHTFARLNIWDRCWELLENTNDDFADPRTPHERLVQEYLTSSQPYRSSRIVQKIDHLLTSKAGW